MKAGKPHFELARDDMNPFSRYAGSEDKGRSLRIESALSMRFGRRLQLVMFLL